MKLKATILVFLFLAVGLIYGDEKATKTSKAKVSELTVLAPAKVLFPSLRICGMAKVPLTLFLLGMRIKFPFSLHLSPLGRIQRFNFL
jgi:hypothetical protein